MAIFCSTYNYAYILIMDAPVWENTNDHYTPVKIGNYFYVFEPFCGFSDHYKSMGYESLTAHF